MAGCRKQNGPVWDSASTESYLDFTLFLIVSRRDNCCLTSYDTNRGYTKAAIASLTPTTELFSEKRDKNSNAIFSPVWQEFNWQVVHPMNRQLFLLKYPSFLNWKHDTQRGDTLIFARFSARCSVTLTWRSRWFDMQNHLRGLQWKSDLRREWMPTREQPDESCFYRPVGRALSHIRMCNIWKRFVEKSSQLRHLTYNYWRHFRALKKRLGCIFRTSKQHPTFFFVAMSLLWSLFTVVLPSVHLSVTQCLHSVVCLFGFSFDQLSVWSLPPGALRFLTRCLC